MAGGLVRHLILAGFTATLLAACMPGSDKDTLADSGSKPLLSLGKSKSQGEEVEAPEVFQSTDMALWDGRPSLGGVWIAAPEAKDPERTLPRAINSIPVRIIVFYVCALLAIMAVTPWRDVVPHKSPFVELFVLAGLPAAAGIINFVVLTSAASSANSGVFSTSRMLYGLALKGDAPQAFHQLSRASVPSRGLIFSCACLLGGAFLMWVIPDLVQAFTLVTTVSAILFMFVWSLILLSYIAYRRQRPALHAASRYKMPGGIAMCWACLAFFVGILVLLTLEADTRQALLATPAWFVLLALAYRAMRQRPAK